MSYSIIIPTYNRHKSLVALIEDIKDSPCTKFPDEIIIADDGSTEEDINYIQPIMSDSLIPIRHLKMPHRGPAYAIKDALETVESAIAIIMHDDIRLRVTGAAEEEAKYYMSRLKLPDNALETLSAMVNNSPTAAIGSPFVLSLQFPRYILHGDICFDEITLRSYSGQWHMFFSPIRRIGEYKWLSRTTTHGYCYALKMEAYRQIAVNGGIDLAFNPFKYEQDLSFQLRQAGHKVYITHNVVVFHSSTNDRPQDSMMNEYSKMADANKQLMAKWYESRLWNDESLGLTSSFGQVLGGES